MKIKDLFFFFLKRGAVLYTAISLPLLVLFLIVSTETTPSIIAPEKFLLIAMFAYAMALGSTLYRVEAFSVTVARIIHASCFIFGFFAFTFLALPDSSSANSFQSQNLTTALVSTAIFAVVYAVVCVITALIKKKTSIFSLSTKKETTKKVTVTPQRQKKEKKSPRTKKSKREENTYTSRFS